MMGREQLLPHLLVINLLLLFLQKGERLLVANSMPILLKHLIGSEVLFPIELRIYLTSLPQGWKEEIVPFLLEQSITYSQVLVSGALASLTLSKRSEILDKSSVNETPKSPGRS
jgi:hypothetical protein